MATPDASTPTVPAAAPPDPDKGASTPSGRGSVKKSMEAEVDRSSAWRERKMLKRKMSKRRSIDLVTAKIAVTKNHHTNRKKNQMRWKKGKK